jgi:ketosteroid isomerase-like protein
MEIKKRSEEVIATIRAMNRCWTEGWNEEQFRQYIHPDAVAVVPTTSGRLERQDAYIAGWRAFCEAAVIHEWRATDYKVQIKPAGKVPWSHISSLSRL